MFKDDDFGPWGSKLDEFENDLSGLMHRQVHVVSRRGFRAELEFRDKAQLLGSGPENPVKRRPN